MRKNSTGRVLLSCCRHFGGDCALGLLDVSLGFRSESPEMFRFDVLHVQWIQGLGLRLMKVWGGLQFRFAGSET